MFKHEFWQAGAENAYWSFLKLSTEEDLEGLSKIKFIYLEKALLNWKNDKINLWVKSCLGFIFNEIEENGFDYETMI